MTQQLFYFSNLLFAGILGTATVYLYGITLALIRLKQNSLMLEVSMLFVTFILGISFIFPLLNCIKIAWNFY